MSYALTVTDLFAGAGGSSTGMAQIPGVHVRYAANHWPVAVAIHNANHPTTDHAAVDLHREDPRFFASTDILWASPECTKWSQAGGSQPRPAIEEGLFEDPLSSDAATRSRLLMFDVLRFAEHHRYRAMVVENVVDIATQDRYRMAWYEWRRQLRELGYKHRVVSLNSMHAQAHGLPAPQSRDRIYIVCWREGERAPDLERALSPKAYCPKCDAVIRGTQSWKNGRTVGRYRAQYLYTHAACGTVVEPAWLPAAAAIDWSLPGERIGDKELKEFFDKKTGASLGWHPLAPKTLARIAAGIARYWGPAVAEAMSVPMEGREGKEARLLDLPARTQTTRLETALVRPGGNVVPLIDKAYGTGRAYPADRPAATFTAEGQHHALVTPYYGNTDHGRPATDPLATVTTRDRHALVTPSGGTWNEDSRPADDPLRTLTTRDAYALVHRHNSGGAEMTTPVFEELRTLTTAGHQSVLTPPAKPTEAQIRRAAEFLPEVRFRMFTPAEVAAGMAFPDTYDWHPDSTRPTSNRDLVKAAGNAVTPPAARDLIATVAAAITGEDHAAPAAVELRAAA